MNTNILDFGASPSLTDNASAIQAAIDSCANSGGGRVTVPLGRYVSGTIRLRSGVEFHLEMGAVLKASADPDTYNSLDEYPQNNYSTNEGWDWKHLIIAHTVENVAITGLGAIEGCAEAYYGEPGPGFTFWWRDGFAMTKGIENGCLRPGQLIVFIESTDITVRDITIRNSTSWCCFFHGCERVSVIGARIYNSRVNANTDGLDIDSCEYVTVSDCIIDTGDDCIAIRGSAAKLTDPSRECRYVTITNCVFGCSAEAIRVGVGYGAVRHVRVSNITVQRACNIVGFNTAYNGNGHCEIEDVGFSGISATNTAHLCQLWSDSVTVKGVSFTDIRAETMASTVIHGGASGNVSNVTLRDIELHMIPTQKPLSDPKVLRDRGDYILELHNIQCLQLENVNIFISPTLTPLWSGTKRIFDCTQPPSIS